VLGGGTGKANIIAKKKKASKKKTGFCEWPHAQKKRGRRTPGKKNRRVASRNIMPKINWKRHRK